MLVAMTYADHITRESGRNATLLTRPWRSHRWEANLDQLLTDVEFLGFLFESLVIRDLRIYAQVTGAQVLQYRDNTGLEVDAVVEASDGRWAAFEVKLGHRMVDEAAANLLRFRDRVDTGKLGVHVEDPRVAAGKGRSHRPGSVHLLPAPRSRRSPRST